MFKTLKNIADRIKESEKNNIDPTRFHDDVALKTSWNPRETAKANFNTLKLVKVSDDLLQYKGSIQMKLFSGIFVGAGIGCYFLFPEVRAGRWLPNTWQELWNLVPSIWFIVGGIFFYFHLTSGAGLFNGRNRLFHQGKGDSRTNISFDEIYAVQLIPQFVRSTDGPDYFNIQLNLVFANGSRAHVANYFKLGRARKDSAIIADFINRKLWDATE